MLVEASTCATTSRTLEKHVLHRLELRLLLHSCDHRKNDRDNQGTLSSVFPPRSSAPTFHPEQTAIHLSHATP